MRKYAPISSSLQPHPAPGSAHPETAPQAHAPALASAHLPSFSETCAFAVMLYSASSVRSIQGLKLIENGIDVNMKEVMETIERLKTEGSIDYNKRVD